MLNSSNIPKEASEIHLSRPDFDSTDDELLNENVVLVKAVLEIYDQKQLAEFLNKDMQIDEVFSRH